MVVQKVNALPPYCSVVRDNGRIVLAFLKHMNPSFAREAWVYLRITLNLSSKPIQCPNPGNKLSYTKPYSNAKAEGKVI